MHFCLRVIFQVQKIKWKWLLMESTHPWHLSVWPSARRWPARARTSVSPSPSTPASLFPWTPRRTMWSPRCWQRKGPALLLREGMQEGERSFWKRNLVLNLFHLLGQIQQPTPLLLQHLYQELLFLHHQHRTLLHRHQHLHILWSVDHVEVVIRVGTRNIFPKVIWWLTWQLNTTVTFVWSVKLTHFTLGNRLKVASVRSLTHSWSIGLTAFQGALATVLWNWPPSFTIYLIRFFQNGKSSR